MMLNDLDTSVFGEENELGDDSPSFYQQTSCAQLHNFFLTTVPGTYTNPNPAEFVSMFAGININNCVFQFSQNPVHGMPSSMTANTDNDHQAPKSKRRRAFILDSDDKE